MPIDLLLDYWAIRACTLFEDSDVPDILQSNETLTVHVVDLLEDAAQRALAVQNEPYIADAPGLPQGLGAFTLAPDLGHPDDARRGGR